MKIGFLGNANNGPFMIARAIQSLGHEVVFVIDSTSPLNRPESRYKDITLPYPSWVIDCSNPLGLWQYPPNLSQTEKIVQVLQQCDALVLNEFGLSIWGRIGKPAFALLTGTDIEVLSDYRYVDFGTSGLDEPTDLSGKLLFWWRRFRQRGLRNHLLNLINAQRDAIRHAVGVHYFPKGMLPNAERLLAEIGVDDDRRVFFFPAEMRYEYAVYPDNRVLRLFNVARITWRKPRDHFISELDYKGTDVLIRGLGLFVRESKIPIEIRLVKKGADLEITRQLIEEEGLASSVIWLEEMDHRKLYEEYKNADIVSDHFGQGSIGMGALDALAVGRPVIANGSPEIFRKALGEAPPICHATTAEGVRDQLLRLAVDCDLRENIGKQSRQYVEKYCDPLLGAKIILEKLSHAK